MQDQTLRVAHTVFSVSNESGGIGPSVKGLVSALRNLSIADARVYVPRRRKSESAPEHDVSQFDCIGPPQHCITRSLGKMLQNDGVNMVHTHGIWTGLSRVNLQNKSKAKIPYIVTPHGMLMPNALKYSRLKKRIVWATFERRHLQSAHCIHALGITEAESIRNNGITTPVCVIGNGIDIDTNVAPSPSRSSTSPRTLLYLGRIHPIKGLINLLEAWKSVASLAETASWRLKIVGWGDNDYLDMLKRFCTTAGIDSQVEFSGPLFGKDKEAAFANADAFVLPSTSEAFPIALLEAWKAGLPCLATTSCMVASKHGSPPGIYVEGDADSISKGLTQLFQVPDTEREELGAAGKSFVAEEYSWEAIAQKFGEVYRWAIGVGAKPSTLYVE